MEGGSPYLQAKVKNAKDRLTDALLKDEPV